MSLECSYCGSSDVIKWYGKRYKCNHCTRVTLISVPKKPVKRRKKPKNINRIRSDKHERRVAKSLNMRQTIASGSMFFDKGDLSSDNSRVECKTTEKKSYTLKLQTLRKIIAETRPGDVPILNIEFQTERRSERFCIIPEDWFQELWENYNDEEEDSDNR